MPRRYTRITNEPHSMVSLDARGRIFHWVSDDPKTQFSYVLGTSALFYTTRCDRQLLPQELTDAKAVTIKPSAVECSKCKHSRVYSEQALARRQEQERRGPKSLQERYTDLFSAISRVQEMTNSGCRFTRMSADLHPPGKYDEPGSPDYWQLTATYYTPEQVRIQEEEAEASRVAEAR